VRITDPFRIGIDNIDYTQCDKQGNNWMSTYVLVHGAWHGAWCWDKVAPLIRSAGHTVYTPDLPGHGERLSFGQRITAEEYADSLVHLITGLDQPVVLTGHSMAGMVISRVAELIPDRISTLVYLAGFLLVDGESINDLENRIQGSIVAPNLILSTDKSALSLPDHIIREGLYNDCNDTDYQYALARLQAQPVQPFLNRLAVSEARFGSVPRVYIECLQDLALPVSTQRLMYANSRCRSVFTLDSGHAPFFSRHKEVADILLQL
jgi:pimeloyl-ACP methyl ester carboxylesterase